MSIFILQKSNTVSNVSKFIDFVASTCFKVIFVIIELTRRNKRSCMFAGTTHGSLQFLVFNHVSCK